MAVPVVNIVIEQGTDFEATFSIVQSDGTALNLTNKSVSSKMRKHHSSLGSIGFGITFGTQPDQGKITISLTDAQSGIITAGRYNYDVIVNNDVSGKKEKVITGQALVNPTIT
tara:strand:+ start:1477 stop:1815 length:339 start_codon:yes stop_codon:yes gene_type:complete